MSTIENYVASEIAKVICEQLTGNPSGMQTGSAPFPQPTGAGTEMAKRVDYTLLKADATEEQIAELCEEAVAYGFPTVCVNSAFVAEAARLLANSPVRVSSVIGFPLGAAGTQAKVAEAQEAVRNGAAEVEMVAHVGMIKSKNWRYFKQDVEEVKRAVQEQAKVHVILETSLLNDTEKFKACLICRLVGVDAVKTSTGFSSTGATTSDIHLMREAAGDAMQIIASGGIRTKEEAEQLLKAGADRIGTGNGIAVATGVSPAQDSGGHVCVGCGNCKLPAGCPTGRVDIIVANDY